MPKIVNKKKFITGISIIIITLIVIILLAIMLVKGIIYLFTNKQEIKKEASQNQISKQEEKTNTVIVSTSVEPQNDTVNNEVLNQWNLKLVNNENSVDRNYVPELAEIADGVKFDKRAISYLKEMINEMYKDNITGIWVQSAYRSYDKQEELFNRQVEKNKNNGKDKEEAERLAQTVVQRPEMSEHNLGLAADFNTVTNEFENTKAFKWLQKNADEYGFILRYPKDKQDITKIIYESWHWRYVGKEHAKVMKEKGYCLEEYIDYLKETKEV